VAAEPSAGILPDPLSVPLRLVSGLLGLAWRPISPPNPRFANPAAPPSPDIVADFTFLSAWAAFALAVATCRHIADASQKGTSGGLKTIAT